MRSILAAGARGQLSLRSRLLWLLLGLVAVERVAGDATRLCLRSWGWGWSGGRFGLRLDYFEWTRLSKLLAFAVFVEDFQVDDNKDAVEGSERAMRTTK